MATRYGMDEQGDLERQLLLDELGRPRRVTPREQGGVTGGRLYAGGSPTFDETGRNLPARAVEPREQGGLGGDAATQEPAKPDFSTWGTYAGAALDPEKKARNHDSPKYVIDRILTNFNPEQGLTPEVIAALNATGLAGEGGEFYSDNGQYLRVRGDKIDPRFEGVLGSDMVRNFKGGGPVRWGGWGSVGAEGPGIRPMATPGGISAPATAPPVTASVAGDGSVYQDAVQRIEELERQILLRQLAPRRAQPRRA